MIDNFREKFKFFFDHNLNADQQRAVAPREGIFLVRAGAGSGKTRVITARILRLLLEYQVPTNSIVALTFTNKAAREMQDRVVHSLPPSIKLPVISTFHSYGLNLLKRYGSLINIAQFSILDSDDREKMLQTIIKRHNIPKRITATSMGSAISRYKNSITSIHQKPRSEWSDPLYHQIWNTYEQERRAAHCLDFDDLLVETLRLFETQPDFKHELQNLVQHILVDEYQDTNRLQHAIIQHMAYTEKNMCALKSLCVVGDENQAIYSWRGATVDNMTKFHDSFPQTALVSITQNYRSVQPVLQTANSVITNNRYHATHEIWSNRKASNRVRFLTCTSSYQEGELVATCGEHFQKTKSLSKLAVLYRSHFQSRALEEALVRNSIPYVIVGGTQFYDRQEIKDLLAYLRLAYNPFDRVSFIRCINTPSRGLGDAFIEQAMEIWSTDIQYSFYDTTQFMLDKKLLPPRKHESLAQFKSIIQAVSSAESVRQSLEIVIERTAFITYLINSYDADEAQERIANVHELSNAIAAMEERGITSLAAFLDEVALVQDYKVHDKQSQEVVRLMTLHSAKGLEFDTVIIPGLEEGLFPSMQSTYQDSSLEEERRLLYVGITRARERLLMTCTETRFMYGTTRQQQPSRFVKELPDECVTYDDTASRFFSQVQQSLTTWLRTSESTHEQRSSPNIPVKQKIIPSLHLDCSFNDLAAKSSSNTVSSKQPSWRLQQRVVHPKFGEGTIKKIEYHPPTTYLTIQFSGEFKKIADTFVKIL
jgi:DNA helicase-2/ATP-dependent DNA helicase PcrA